MITTVRNYLEEELTWERRADPLYPFEAETGGECVVIRLNDFPDNPLYTLLVNDEEVTSFDDWPKQWTLK